MEKHIHVVIASSSSIKIEKMEAVISSFAFRTGIKLIPVTLDNMLVDHISCIEPYYNYESNAILKVDTAYYHLNEGKIIGGPGQMWFDHEPYIIMANDSGLEIPFLNGWPGIFTKRCGKVASLSAAEAIIAKLGDNIKDLTKNCGELISATTIMCVRPSANRERVANAPNDRKEMLTEITTQDVRIIDTKSYDHVHDICRPYVKLSDDTVKMAPDTLSRMDIQTSWMYGDYCCVSVENALMKAKPWMESMLGMI